MKPLSLRALVFILILASAGCGSVPTYRTGPPRRNSEEKWERLAYDTGNTLEFNSQNLDDTMGWLARLVLKVEAAPKSSRDSAQRDLAATLDGLKGKEIDWELIVGGPDYCLGGRYVLPIADNKHQCHHSCYISVSARDKREPVRPNPFSDGPDAWDGQVIRLLPSADVSMEVNQRIMRGTGAGVHVSGKLVSIVYVAAKWSYMKIYLEDCVPHVKQRAPRSARVS
jgi:hypothetical protein